MYYSLLSKHIRAQLRELEQSHLDTLNRRLQMLHDAPINVDGEDITALATKQWFDFSLPTTDSKQATAHILTSCGFEFQNVFNNPFKK